MDSTLLKSITDSIHERCSEEPKKYYGVDDLQSMDPRITNLEILMTVVNHMLAQKLLKAMQQGDESVFQIVDFELAERLRLLTPEESLLFTHIDASGPEGIWTKHLKFRTNLHQSTITKSLKTLETKKLIKCIKSVKHPTRKIYMLYSLQPSLRITGGPWFTDSELDGEFINALKDAIERLIYERSYPRGMPAASWGKGWEGVTVEGIAKWVRERELTEVELEEKDIKALVDVLVFDRRIERVGLRGYRSVRGAMGKGTAGRGGVMETPCGHCEVKELCGEGGPINAGNCIYWADWLRAVTLD